MTTTYDRKRVNYRRIWEENFGPIPVDEQGRTYDIHHVDGDHTNNSPANLQAIPIRDHYRIHHRQGDWYACHQMAARMRLSPDEISMLGRLENQRRIANGTHNFLGGDVARKVALQRVTDGTHNFLGGELSRRRVSNGTHHLLGGEIQRRTNRRRIEAGTHQNQVEHVCPHCGKIGRGPAMLRYHFDRCKQRPD